MRDKNKKCIAKKCEDCNFFRSWEMENMQTKERKMSSCCSFDVLFDCIPKLIGSIDGLQGGVNEARNRSVETKVVIENLGSAFAAVANRAGNAKQIGEM